MHSQASSDVLFMMKLLSPDSLDISADGLNRIDLKVLDASFLLEKTESMPLYTIIEKPEKTGFMKVNPHNGEPLFSKLTYFLLY